MAANPSLQMSPYITGKFSRLTIGLAMFLFPAGARASDPQTEEPEGLLQRIRSRTAAQLSQLPNYTCHQVVDRLFKRPSDGSLNRMDRVEVEVAFIGNRELFGRPGDSRIEEESITSIVRSGTIGNGAFGSNAYAIFFGEEAEFKYGGQHKKEGQTTLRYDFQVSQEKSHFLLRHDSVQGMVGYKGSFWVNAETLDLVRLELKVDHIPSYLGVRYVQEAMRYTKVRIRDSEFLLPNHSEMAAMDASGFYTLNMISLEACREFTGQSVVTFGKPIDDKPAEGNSADRQEPNP
jgi:hypothetical protein